MQEDTQTGDLSIIDQISEAANDIPTGIEIVKTDTSGNVVSKEVTKEKEPEPSKDDSDDTSSLEDGDNTTEEETTKDESADATDQEDDEEEETLPEVEEPTELLQGNDLIGHLRKQGELRKKDAKTLREKEKRISELEAQLEQSNAPATPETTNQKINASDVFRAMVEINNGDRQQSDMQIVNEQLAIMSLDELDSVMEKAEMGAFGDMSQDVLDVTRANEPKIRRLDRQRSKLVNAETQWKKENAEAWDTVRSIHGMTDKDSEIYQSFTAAEQSLLKLFPKIKLQSDAPLRVLDYMELTRQANKSPKVSVLEKENARLRKQLNLDQGGLSTEGTTKGDTSGAKTPEEQLAIDLGVALSQ